MPEPAKGRDVMVGSLSEARINVKIATNQRLWLWGGRGIPRPAQSRWLTREQIRAACMIALAPLLEKRGLAFRDRGAGNVEVLEYKGLLIKASYWRWPDHDLAGNSGNLRCQFGPQHMQRKISHSNTRCNYKCLLSNYDPCGP